MFEFESGVRKLTHEAPLFPPGALESILGTKIRRRCLTVWQEHCSECAMPGCYSTCSFYTPRWDYKCRRFPDGVCILPATEFTAAPMRFRFGKWARLLGNGPTPLHDLPTALRAEARALKLAEWVNRVGTVRGLSAPVMRRRVNSRSQPRPFGAAAANLYLVIEAYNADPAAASLSLSCKVLDGPGAREPTRAFEAVLTFAHGYTALALKVSNFVASDQEGRCFSIQLAPSNSDESPELTFGLIDIVELDSAPSPSVLVVSHPPAQVIGAPKVKCVIWDLDNTVWEGILVEDDVARLRLRPEAVDAIRELDRKGILQSVASKNDPDVVAVALQHFGLTEYFLAPQISWGPKSNAITAIAQSLNISSDSFAFVDDQKFERAEVTSRHPEVLVLDSADLSVLLTHDRFSVEITSEATLRRRLYQDEEKRTSVLETVGGDYEEFLRSCSMRVEISALHDADVTRAHELAQRTNQLNVWASRYTADQLRALLDAGSSARAFTIRADDRFGTYGLVGLCILDQANSMIQDLMFSCRIQGKLVGETFIAWLAARNENRGEPLQARYKANRKNGPARALLEATGFEPAGDLGDGERWMQTRPFRTLYDLGQIVQVHAPPTASNPSGQ